MAADTLYTLLRDAVGSASLVEALPRQMARAPSWLDPNADTWNVAPLHRRSDKKIWTLDFTRVSHPELQAVARAHAVWSIVERQLGPQSLSASLYVFAHLGQRLGARPLQTLRTEDFHAVEQDIVSHYAERTSARMCADLQRVAAWLTRQTGLRLDYRSMRRAPAAHGREATDDGRAAKLLPDSVIADLLNARHLPDLPDRDRFYLSAIAISVATGFRLGELLTLPSDCLIQDRGALLVRSFVSKHGKAAPRPVPPELADIVIDAVDHIRDVTRPAREKARTWAEHAPIDWAAIIRDPDPTAFEYFVRRWLSDWIANPVNRIIDPRCAYFSCGDRSQWVPLADLLDAHGGNISAVSREVGIGRASMSRLVAQLEASRRGEVYLGKKTAESRRAFDTDRRIPSIMAFKALTGRNLQNSPRNARLADLIAEARDAQIKQTEYPSPHQDLALEERCRVAPEVLRDPETGEAVLNLHEALFVLFKNQLSDTHVVDTGRIKAVSINQFNHWLAGYKRDRGTGKPGDALCARLGILDPRTEEPAKLTNHDFRHWLETAYENGGMSQTQIATLFNRSSSTSNSVYDHTNSSVRRERLKDAMADGLLIGHAAEAYVRIAEESPEDATAYLESAVKFQNPMPHGICRLNWALEPCPHALSCFSCGDAQDDASEPCEHLIVDTTDAAQIDQIAQIHCNAQSIVQIMTDDGAEDSPQLAQFQRIARSTRSILTKAGRP
ncbi:hypothetical protein SAMN05421759_101703 [Roseivivax lentus]|uniref:Phage integrase family protein n=1 Tax=Roseivivax lentus TaxID=633194 RepID=A0A1N7KFA9_9RHOB|nr:hypothetical protein [Roseivivax lentus]SIS60255.1 hypothetical protein SAMN05421759_101703 [Roseivivax lentus]